MIGPSGAVRVLVATKPVDFRKGAEGVPALVREEMRADPFGGAIFVFRAKRADRIKLIFWDCTGLCLYAERLEEGEFRWPRSRTARSGSQPPSLGRLDWRRVHQGQRTRTPLAAG